VSCFSPCASNTASPLAVAKAIAGGAGIGRPSGPTQADGAKRVDPSLARTATQGEYFAPGGVLTQRPSSQYQRPRLGTHSPGIHASAFAGLAGTSSTRPGGGSESTGASADDGCPA
jgi:hypothetical protein